MESKVKTYRVFNKTERQNWEDQMGKNYLKAGNLRKTNKDRIKFDLNIGEIGELRVVESTAGPCELYVNSDYQNKSTSTGVLEEFLVVSGSIKVFFENATYKLKKGDILIYDNTNPVSYTHLTLPTKA